MFFFREASGSIFQIRRRRHMNSNLDTLHSHPSLLRLAALHHLHSSDSFTHSIGSIARGAQNLTAASRSTMNHISLAGAKSGVGIRCAQNMPVSCTKLSSKKLIRLHAPSSIARIAPSLAAAFRSIAKRRARFSKSGVSAI